MDSHLRDTCMEAFGWFVLIMILAAVPRSTFQVEDVRILSFGSTISLNLTSPSYSAFYDQSVDFVSNFESSEVTQLVAGETKFLPEQEMMLTGANNMDIKIGGGIEVKSNLAIQNVSEHRIQAFPVLYDESGDLLPLEQRKQKLTQYLTNSEVDLSNSSWKAKAKELVSEAPKLASPEERTQTVITSSIVGSSPIVISRPKDLAAAPQAPRKTNRENKQNKSGEANDRIVAQNDDSNDFSFEPVEPPVIGRHILSGQISLLGGLGITSANELNIFWEDQGEFKQAANLWLQQGRYELVVEKLSGYLVGQILNQEGEVLSEVEVDLQDLNRPPYHGNKISGLDVKFEPSQVGLKVRVISARTFEDHVILAPGAQLLMSDIQRQISEKKEGWFVDREIVKGSDVELIAQLESYWTTVVSVIAGTVETIKLYPQGMVNALLEMSNPAKREGLNVSHVIGRVLINGKATENAKVELAGPSEMQPTYFKSLSKIINLPDIKLLQTSINGMFAFLGLNSGTYALRAKVAGKYYPATLFDAKNQTIRQVELNYEGFRTAGVNILDPINQIQKLSGTVNVYGADLEINIFGKEDETIRFPKANHQIMLEVDAGEPYWLTRSFINKTQRAIALPVIPKDWIRDVIEKFEIAETEAKNIVVGWVHGDDFDLIASEDNQEMKTIYFDENGNLLNSTSGSNGGGFIIFNLKEGIQSLTILPQQKKTLSIQKVYPEPQFVNTIDVTL